MARAGGAGAGAGVVYLSAFSERPVTQTCVQNNLGDKLKLNSLVCLRCIVVERKSNIALSIMFIKETLPQVPCSRANGIKVKKCALRKRSLRVRKRERERQPFEASEDNRYLPW